MAPFFDPGEPKQSPKPQPLGNFTVLFLFTTCTACIIFLLWKRASSLRTVVAHQMRTWTGAGEGGIRLSTDDGPPAREFIDEDNEDEDDASHDDEPLPAAPWAPSGRQVPPALDGHPRAEDAPLQNPLSLPPKP